MEVYHKALVGNDMVAAVPQTKVKIISQVFYYLLKKLSNSKSELYSENFRITSRRLINKTSSENSFNYRKINYKNSGLKTDILKYPLKNEKKNSEDFNFRQKISLASNVLIYYSNFGTKICLWLCVSFFLISFLGGSYSILSYILKENSVQPGWTTTMLFISISFCGLFLVLGIIAKYLEVLLKELIVKTPYSYSSIDSL